MNTISITNLTKKYGSITAVDNLNLTINEGELFALLGLNGAGKTTSIKMLSCLEEPTNGDAILLGDSICTGKKAIKKKTNISPQETAVAPNLTVAENLEFIAGIYGQDGKAAKESANEMAQKFGLNEIRGKKARTLSGGMQRRLSIAMALISSPKIVFLDEPTLGLDVLVRRELWSLIKALRGKITIIMTTHYMEEVEALADRIGVMSKGKLLNVGTVNDLIESTGTANLEDAFLALAGGVI